MGKEVKTNAMRILDRAKVPYRFYTYEPGDKVDGITVANKMGQPLERVYKTLVARGKSGGYFVFVIPGAAELDLKRAAKSVGEKSVQMIHVKEINQITGYIRGGCSPIGMKKPFPTYLDETAELYDEIGVSAGQRGCQILLAPGDLVHYVNCVICDLTE